MTTIIDTYGAAAQSYFQSGAARDDRAVVPCNGCTACCQHELLFLHPELGDKVEDYLTQEVIATDGSRQTILQHQPNGDCIYLDRNTGCTIHDRAPAICREFDCRRLFLQFQLDYERADRRKYTAKNGVLDKKVMAAGRARVKTLPSWLRALAVQRSARGVKTANWKLGNLFR